MNNYIELNGHKYYCLKDDIQRPYTFDCAWINDQLYVKGKLVHREDGPAVEYSNGIKDYLQYGKLHRIGGPAVEGVNGYKIYFENGNRHREDGAAVEYKDSKGKKRYEYWLHGEKFKNKKDMIHYLDYLIIFK